METKLGKTIRILRQAKGLKLNDLAKASGVSVPFLSLVESGQRQPSLNVVRRIAKALRIPSEVLVLLGLGDNSSLGSKDDDTNRLAKAVASLIDTEERLGRLLNMEDLGATKGRSTGAHRRGDANLRK